MTDSVPLEAKRATKLLSSPRNTRNSPEHHPETKQAKPNRQRLEEPRKHHQNCERAGNLRNSSARAGKYVKKKIKFNPKKMTADISALFFVS